MGQNDFTIANQSFPSFRSDLNDALQAIATNNAGSTAPSTTYAYQWWYDEANDLLKIRNAGNDAWITFASFDQTTDTFLYIGSKSTNVQEFTSSGSYTPSDGARIAFVEVLGAGGGGGGTAAAVGEGGCGGGGGSGGYSAKWIDLTALTGNPTITVGAAGAKGGAGGNSGSAGGNSSYDDTGVGGSDTLTGSGGRGGTHASKVPVSQAARGGDGGAASGGDVNAHGQPGGAGFVLDGSGGTGDVIGGFGGSSRFGGGGPTQEANNTGIAGQGYGAGGSGASQQGTTNRAGGDGADGYVRITEYF